MMMQATITGSKLHGVGYRSFLLDQALAIGVQRFDARNIKRNELQQVIVRAEGESNQIESFGAYIREEHPPDAVISDITFQECSGYIMSIIDFLHVITFQQLSKGIPAILSIERMQGQRLNKQDQMLQKMDHMESSITGEI
ncbi:MAG: acylphosphatase [Methanoregula sp.]|jgi:acylphosphatase|nr:acylphosphatase [Methanoregula sp.]